MGVKANFTKNDLKKRLDALVDMVEQKQIERLHRLGEMCLIVVVAGMNYAAYVEAKGYNVLASAEHLAERELPRMLEKLISSVKRAAE